MLAECHLFTKSLEELIRESLALSSDIGQNLECLFDPKI
jgi:hypothetical protein